MITIHVSLIMYYHCFKKCVCDKDDEKAMVVDHDL